MATDDLLKELLGQGKKKDVDPLQYLRIIWRKKHLVLIPLVLSWAIAAVGIIFATSSTSASSVRSLGSSLGSSCFSTTG